jgi:hypothetical protein
MSWVILSEATEPPVTGTIETSFSLFSQEAEGEVINPPTGTIETSFALFSQEAFGQGVDQPDEDTLDVDNEGLNAYWWMW